MKNFKLFKPLSSKIGIFHKSTTSYYVSLNLGLAENDLARFLAYTLLDEFEGAGDLVFKPNIVFKVVGGVYRFPEDRNYDLFRNARRFFFSRLFEYS